MLWYWLVLYYCSVSALCSACAQPRWESEWKFNIEDGVAINNNSNKKCKMGDGMKGKAGKGKKLSRGMGRVFYHRPPRVVLLSPWKIQVPPQFFFPRKAKSELYRDLCWTGLEIFLLVKSKRDNTFVFLLLLHLQGLVNLKAVQMNSWLQKLTAKKSCVAS